MSSLKGREMYQFGPFSLDPTERVISRNGTPLTVTPKVFDTLLCLVRNPGRVLTKDELLKEIWPDTFVEEVNLAVNISTLRKILGENPQEAHYIATISGRGYKFVAEVQEVQKEDRCEDSAKDFVLRRATSDNATASVVPKGTLARVPGTRAIPATTAILAIGVLLAGDCCGAGVMHPG